jgi:NAD(P)-dependent dehydrogenase (short-subunit alcohol dehydrogenase family)
VTDGPIVVTGAASGIGRATARRMASGGARVVGLDLDAAGLEALGSEAWSKGRLETIIVDVADAPGVTAAIEELVARAGPVWALVNAAGIGGTAPFLEVDGPTWDRVLGTHLGGTVTCTRAVLPGMLRAGHGRIVNVLTDGLWHGRTTVPYTTAKGAILGFTRSLATEVAADGVRINAVAPGPVDTPMLHAGPPDEVAAELATVPIGRALTADEIAATIAFLLGPGGEAYVGQVLAPNGGTVFAG